MALAPGRGSATPGSVATEVGPAAIRAVAAVAPAFSLKPEFSFAFQPIVDAEADTISSFSRATCWLSRHLASSLTSSVRRPELLKLKRRG